MGKKFKMMRNFIKYIFLFISFIFSNDIYRIPIEGTIDLGLPPFIERTIKEAEKKGVSTIIFEINKTFLDLINQF